MEWQALKSVLWEGMLTDHYNPVNKTINLSRDVYYETVSPLQP